jgi:hypothetical protein
MVRDGLGGVRERNATRSFRADGWLVLGSAPTAGASSAARRALAAAASSAAGHALTAGASSSAGHALTGSA